jgi:hypothetical protein
VQHRLWRLRANADAAISTNAHFFRWCWLTCEEANAPPFMQFQQITWPIEDQFMRVVEGTNLTAILEQEFAVTLQAQAAIV